MDDMKMGGGGRRSTSNNGKKTNSRDDSMWLSSNGNLQVRAGGKLKPNVFVQRA